MTAARFEVLEVGTPDVLGEGPWWDTAEQQLHWVDIKGHRIRRSRLDGSDAWEAPTAGDVGFAVPTVHGTLLVGLRDGVHEVDPDTGAPLQAFPIGHDVLHHRINDGKTDRRGRLWFGSMHDAETSSTAAFYRLDADGVHGVLDGIITSNGLGWSPDGTVMYHTDSLTRTISAYDVDDATGDVTGARVFARDPDGYVPDGLTVDVDGCVWSAKWDGGSVVRYAPDGAEVSRIEVPVSRPTSAMFAGRDLDVLAVTTAMTPGTPEPLAGRVLLLDVGVRGLPERRAVAPLPPRAEASLLARDEGGTRRA